MQPAGEDVVGAMVALAKGRGNRDLARQLEGGGQVILQEGRRLRLVSATLAARLPDWERVLGPANPGEPWGDWHDDHWSPSLAALVHVGARSGPGRIVLTKEGSQFFLYGREVYGAGVRHVDPELNLGDEGWVCDEGGTSLGLGRLVGSRRSSGAVVAPVADLGWYLREGG